ncbi:DnaT-like ssDNA-binding domain-containing protein [Zhongshania guokunii]|uniref:DnaT-like ssDNA-binding domain-containing protein n=1 Tax=Zhongshania guokunii TaxID=641783 RepID=A0ABV3U6K9_9GAMM
MAFVARISDDEEVALRGLRAEARVLYICGLRPFMDFKTGLVGVKRRVSYQGFKELLEVTPDRGSAIGAVQSPTKSALRALLQLLERHGLVEKLEQRRRIDPMVFKLPLADYDAKIRLGEQRHTSVIGQATQQATQEKPHNSILNQHDSDVAKGGIDIEQKHIENSTKRHTSVLPVNNIITTSAAVIDFRPRESSYQNKVDQWVPSSEVWAMLKMRGVDPVYAQEKLGEYQIYWRDRGAEKVSWDSHFISHCVQQWRMFGHVWRAAASAEQGQKGFIDKHLDRSWADGVGGDE